MTYTNFQDVFSEEVWTTTYKDYKDGTIDDTFRRVARTIASAEDTPTKQKEWEEKFYDMLTNFKGVAGGRIISNAGTEWTGTTFANCYVGPLPNSNLDSIDGIYTVLKQQAQTLKSEGGWGMDFSWIRPRGAFIHGVGVESPGSISFMELFDKSSEIVTSGSGVKATNSKAKGKIRKGAMMATMSVYHADIIEFITAKQTPNKLSKFNMSVNCNQEFMVKVNAVMRGDLSQDSWDLCFPDTTHPAYKTEWRGSFTDWKNKGYPLIVYQTVKVSWLWNLIMESTYNRNEPGVLFLDRANEFNPFNYGEWILSTNPCVSGDTIVSTDKGDIIFTDLVSRIVSGEEIKALTYNISTKENEYENIVFADKTRDAANIIQIELEDGKILKLTPDHKVYTSNRGYINASELTHDDDLIIL